MASFLLLHGASSTGWLWHRVRPLLADRGHDSVAPDLPCEDPDAGLVDYLDAACAAVADELDAPVIVVAQSMAGLIAPLIPARRPVRGIVLVAAMIPVPGETGGEWWVATGQPDAQQQYLAEQGVRPPDPFDPEAIFVHDFPEALKTASLAHVVDQQVKIMAEPSPLTGWPAVPTLVVAAADDRLFPLPFMRAQAADRLHLEPVVIPGGHLAALTQPIALAHQLDRFATSTS